MTSVLQTARYQYQPKLPPVFGNGLNIRVKPGTEAAQSTTVCVADRDALGALFKHTYGKPPVTFEPGEYNAALAKPLVAGVILSGGQAPGGHNVIAGLFDGLKKGNAASRLIGFRGGPSGLIEDTYVEITGALMDEYRNTGGFDMIGSGRTKIETDKQFAASLETATKRGLDAVVIIGGDDSNTNAALLAEYFAEKGSAVQVIGCPKTIDGDLKNEYIEASFGFDTACKTYSELIGNIGRDANSAKKYWHFIKLMGRSASHIALECALQTHPNICLISEEVAAKQMTLDAVVDQIAESVVKRAENGENFGIALIPEGLVEFIPEMKTLIAELNDLMAAHEDEFSGLHSFGGQRAFLEKYLSRESTAVFESIPEEIAKQLLFDRDPHGNVQVSRIETEKLIVEMLEKRLAKMKAEGLYKGKFSALGHFFGYEGRCAFPSNFDADYCYSLGYTAFMLIASGLSDYISSVRNISGPASAWTAGGVPLTMMMNMEQRHGKQRPVIRKALVELDGAPFKEFVSHRAEWAVKTRFVYPGSIQYYGPPEVCDQPTITLKWEHPPVA
ncbi:MAG: diphosphate--fructose-6-phosphate 1-phosphotransferase [Spirochaetaceae bacterium]|jgi:pyrophosphate--fructose-6-phosphate 1-phosphotransferase|nr:diphosphate--fructose-6-phosphate 1-phosphotransferase [Spirochaetaceae bacterium]